MKSLLLVPFHILANLSWGNLEFKLLGNFARCCQIPCIRIELYSHQRCTSVPFSNGGIGHYFEKKNYYELTRLLNWQFFRVKWLLITLFLFTTQFCVNFLFRVYIFTDRSVASFNSPAPVFSCASAAYCLFLPDSLLKGSVRRFLFLSPVGFLIN